ncbi:MAG: hypothetical protein ABEJ27_06645 [Halodesulfurarchaeum sp.]
MFSSARRAQVEPLPALVALAVFAMALSVYGVAFGNVLPASQETSGSAIGTKALAAVTEGTVVRPGRLEAGVQSAPSGHRVAIVVRVEDRIWRAGPSPPTDAHTISRTVIIRTADGARPGRIRVSTWT